MCGNLDCSSVRRMASANGSPAVVTRGCPRVLDPWLCVPAFRQVCPCHARGDSMTVAVETGVDANLDGAKRRLEELMFRRKIVSPPPLEKRYRRGRNFLNGDPFSRGNATLVFSEPRTAPHDRGPHWSRGEGRNRLGQVANRITNRRNAGTGDILVYTPHTAVARCGPTWSIRGRGTCPGQHDRGCSPCHV